MKEIASPFQEHLKKTQQLSLNSNPDFLMGYLHNQLDIQGDSLFETFLQGELAFYSKDYKNALKYYLQARDIPDFQFYCHRASALLSHEMGQKTKALIFANKALKIHPEDNVTLKILDLLYNSYQEKDKSKAIEGIMHRLHHAVNEDDLLGILSEIKSLADNNLKELHACNETGIEELFSQEMQEKEGDLHKALLLESKSPMKGNPAIVAKEILKEFIREGQEGPKFDIKEKKPFSDLSQDHKPEIASQKPSLISEGVPCSPIDSSMIDKLEEYSRSYRKLLEDYLYKASLREKCQDNCMVLFNTWNKEAKEAFLLDPTTLKHEFNSGFFIRFAGKGIAINPGARFLEALHQKNFTLLDIDYVIVTHSKREALQEISGIYEFALELNRLLGKPHIIHYYFNRVAYQEMIQVLKPRYRQEKSALHCLEIYLDTPDVEKIELQKEIVLGYFLTSKSFNPLNPSESLNLGIKLELEDAKKKRSIAYVSSSQWTPLLQHHIGPIDILVVGFGSTQQSDLEKERYLDDNLGYFGTLTLIQEASPSLALITEFDQKIAGARLEIIKRMREELFKDKSKTIVLPGDPNLDVDLTKLKIRCSITKEWIPPQVAKIVRGTLPLSRLQFLSPTSTI